MERAKTSLMILGAKVVLSQITEDESLQDEIAAAVEELEAELCPELLRIGLETFLDATTRSI